MSKLNFRMPSPALVIAIAAMFVALGSVSYAATQLKKNSVGTKQIKKNAVNSAKVKNKSLKSADFKPGQLPAGSQGIQGPQGVPGQDGAQGTPGPPGLSGYQQVMRESSSSTTSTHYVLAPCPPGKLVLGGGAVIFEGEGKAFISISTPSPTTNSYIGETRTVNSSPVVHKLRVYAVCADVTP